MAIEKLADPILNDLQLMINGRRLNDLGSAAVSRYSLHLKRLDRELSQARDASGNRPVRAADGAISVSLREFNELRGAVQTSAQQLQDQAAELGDLRLLKAAYDTLTNALFEEFGEALRTVEGAGPTECILALLRAWRPEAPHAESVDSAPDAGRDDSRSPDASANPRTADHRARTRRAS